MYNEELKRTDDTEMYVLMEGTNGGDRFPQFHHMYNEKLKRTNDTEMYVLTEEKDSLRGRHIGPQQGPHLGSTG
jgi:predicted nucleotide-binding protein (sugar kinase/HSP70/actin superfamily)